MPKQRSKIVSATNGNQWVYTPKQQQFINLWLSPNSKTYGNAYRSAVSAGFSTHYAKVITARYTGLEWVRDAKRTMIGLQPHEIMQQLWSIAVSGATASERLSALDKLARMHGMYKPRTIVAERVVFKNTVPRP